MGASASVELDPTRSRFPQGAAVVDPWSALTAVEALEALKNEDGEVVDLESGEDLASTGAPADSSLRVLGDGCGLREDALAAFVASGQASGRTLQVVFLSVASNKLTSLAPLDSDNRLRGLSAGANPLSGFPTLRGCSALLVDLDLSYCALGPALAVWAPGAPPPLAHLAALLRLNLTSCDLTAWACGPAPAEEGGPAHGGAGGAGGFALLLGGLAKLRELTLAENPLSASAAAAGAGLEPVPALLELDLRDTPLSAGAAAEAALKRVAAERCPSLGRLNGKSLRVAPGLGLGAAAAHPSGKDGKSAPFLLDAPSMASFEKEFDSAMKGERDNTIVA